MKNMTLDGLLDDLLTCTDADFELRNVCTKREVQAYLDAGTLPNGWQKPRSVLFKMVAALAIAEYTDTSTRPADSVADFCYMPSECPVCDGPSMQGSIYCSERCRKIQEGEPTMQELASN